ncbi:MAG: hypothetical protein ACTSVI_09320, partial [Promethearchaeota archaeon]
NATRDYIVVEERPYNTPFSIRVLIDNHFKLVVYHEREFGELYDIKNDPDQIVNLWSNPSFSSVKSSMMMKLLSSEMNKRQPNPNWSRSIDLSIPKEARDIKEYLSVTGRLVWNDDGLPCLMLPLTLYSPFLEPIPLEDILDDFVNQRVVFQVGDDRMEGVLKVGKGLYLDSSATSSGSGEIWINAVLKKYLNCNILIHGFRDVLSDSTGGSVLVIKVKKRFCPNPPEKL